MNVSGLSRDNVASHLQKHRLGLKRGKSRKRRGTPAATQLKVKQVKAVETCADKNPIADAGSNLLFLVHILFRSNFCATLCPWLL
jgi:hypothetical protein